MAALTRKISADEARSLRAGDLRGDVLQKVASAAPSTWNAAQRSARFTMTAQIADRYGDVVMTAGLDTTEFMRNPVAFLNHASMNFPIGSWQNVTKYLFRNPPHMQGDLTLAASGGPIAQIDEAAWAIEHGLMKAASIGFLPNWDSVEKIVDAKGNWSGGLQFNEAELLECSLCGIPANPQALARGLGISARGLHLPSARAVARRRRELELQVLRWGPRR
jgi:hypothetical protein